MEDNLKKNKKHNEDNQKKIWKTTSKKEKKMEDDLKKIMKDEPINQNQPNWL